MFRSLFAALVVSFVAGCGPADSVAGRCTADAQCPVGASCDETIGVCVVGGSSSQTGGVNQSQPKSLPANYGHYCNTDAQCGDVAGTSCRYNECTFNCANGAICPSGTVCTGATGSFACMQDCSSTTEVDPIGRTILRPSRFATGTAV
jgi:hypothetical protein